MDEPTAGQKTPEQLRVDRWTAAAADVPESFTNDQLLRSIAAHAQVQATATKVTAGWVTFIGLVVAVQVILVLMVVLGAITLETSSGGF